MLKALNRYFAKHGRATFIAILVLIVGPFVFLFGSNRSALTQGSLFGGNHYGTLFGRPVDQDQFLLHMYAQVLPQVESLDHMEAIAAQVSRERHKYAQQASDAVLNRMRILHEAKKQGFAHVTEAQLRDAFREFAPFRKDGDFSRFKYTSFKNDYLPKMFFNMVQFEQMMKDNIVIERYVRRFMNITVTDAEARALYLQSSLTPRYKIHEVVRYDVKPTEVKVTKEEIKKAYDANKQPGGQYYRKPTTSLRVALFKAGYEPPPVEISDEQIKAEYEKERESRYTEEQVKVRHILIKFEGDDPVSKAAAREKIEGILKQAREGKDFAELAKEHSEDPGSKEKGGLYDFFGRGRMVPPFTKAAFSLKEGEISEPVETRYGYHIIKKLDERDHLIPLEKAKAGIKRRLRRERQNERDEKAAREYYDEQLALDQTRPEDEKKYIQRQYHFLHILVENPDNAETDETKLNQEKAEMIRKKAVETDDFKAVAREYSDGAEREDGGDLDWIPESKLNLHPYLAEALDLDTGEISEVIDSPQGFHIVKKVEEKVAPVPFAKIKSQVLSDFRTQRDNAIKEAAETAAASFAKAAREAGAGKSYGETKVAFEKLIAKNEAEAVTTNFFNEDARRISGIPDQSDKLVKAAQTLTRESPLTEAIGLSQHYVVACLNGTKPGRVPDLKEVEAMIESDLRQAKQLAEARRQAQEMYLRLKEQLEQGKDFQELAEAKKFRPYQAMSNPYYQDPRKAQFDAAAGKTAAGNVTIVNTDAGATLIYVEEQELPESKSFEKIAGGLKSMQRQREAQILQSGYAAELESRYPFTPNPDWAEIFDGSQEERPSQ